MKVIIDISNGTNLQNSPLLIPYLEESKNFGRDLIKVGLLDNKGNVVLKATYDFVIGDCIEPDDIIVLGKIGYINNKIPYSQEHPFIRIDYSAYNVSKGMLLEGFHSYSLSTDKKLLTVQRDYFWGVINSDGEWIIPYGTYTWIDGYHNGYVRARKGHITNGVKGNDAQWSLINSRGFCVYSGCYDIMPFYKERKDYTEILREKDGLWEKRTFKEITDFLLSLSGPKPDYDPYDNREWLHRYDGSTDDAFEGDNEAYWNID